MLSNLAQLLIAINNEDLEKICGLVDSSAALLAFLDKTALQSVIDEIATENKDFSEEIKKWLVSPVSQNILHLVTSKGMAIAVAPLVSKGVPINAKNEKGFTAFHLAIISERDSEGNKLNFVSKEKKHSLAESLLELKADLAVTDNYGYGLIHYAAAENNIKLIELLKRSGADIDAVSKSAKTPLHTAAMCGNLEALNKLIELGANIEAVGFEGATPLHNAIKYKNIPCVISLLEAGADISAIVKGCRAYFAFEMSAYQAANMIIPELSPFFEVAKLTDLIVSHSEKLEIGFKISSLNNDILHLFTRRLYALFNSKGASDFEEYYEKVLCKFYEEAHPLKKSIDDAYSMYKIKSIVEYYSNKTTGILSILPIEGLKKNLTDKEKEQIKKILEEHAEEAYTAIALTTGPEVIYESELATRVEKLGAESSTAT